MNRDRLLEILSRFESRRVLVIGDYFLDKYLEIERRLTEVSIETGLEAHQVVAVRSSPGAAGTVVSNLRALGVQVAAMGVLGDDGEGYDLLKGLKERGVDTARIISTDRRLTPTYTKPMMHEADGRVHELSRLDIKNRTPLPRDIEDRVITSLREAVSGAHKVDAVIVADQVPEDNCGVITERVRQELVSLAREHAEMPFAADSRMRIGRYRHVILKPNEHEALRALGRPPQDAVDEAQAREVGLALARQCGSHVFLTLGDKGMLLCGKQGAEMVPAVKVSGEIDIVGAGDSALAGIVSSLCSGATPEESAVVGNLVASITIRCIGTTGTASQQEVAAALDEWERGQENS